MTDTPAFDHVAGDYDAEFTDQLLGRWLRECVWRHTPFTAPMHILELGCGTGEDARHFAQMGISVLATDASGEMLAIAQQKNEHLLHEMGRGSGGGVSFRQLDLNALPHAPIADAPFDAVFANFGVINCVRDREAVARFIYDHLADDGVAVIVTMTRTCPIEILWHVLHLRPKQAIRRFFGGRMVDVGGGGALQVWYPTHRQLRREFARAGLHLERMVGIGVTLPPPYLAPLVNRYPRFWGVMRRLEHRLASIFPFTRLNDHTLMRFRKR